MKIVLVLFIIFILVSVYAVYLALNKKSQLEKYKEVRVGMSKDEMLYIMGKDYMAMTHGDKTSYEWKANVSQNYSGLVKVIIDVENDKVTDVRHYKK